MKSPKFIKRLYSYIPWKLRMGKEYRKTYSFLEKSEDWDKGQWEEYQLTSLRKLLAYCEKHVPYYTRIFDQVDLNVESSDILTEYRKLPFLTKKDVVNYSEELVSTKLNSNNIYKASTGGTTDKPVTIYFDNASYKREWAFKIYVWNRAIGYNPDSKKASFRGVKLGKKLFYENPIYNEVRFSPFKMDDKSLADISKKLLEYNPDFLHGYPSAIEQLVKYLSKNDINLSVSGIMLVSENIFPYQKELFEGFFNAPIYSFYGHTERCVLASMDSNLNNYYPHPAYGYTELIDKSGEVITENGKTGEIVGTGFINKGMPLIKYRTGDYSYWNESNNNDWDTRGLSKIKGRWNQEFLIGENEKQVSLTALNMHSGVFQNIKKHQFYQDSEGEVVFRVVKGDEFDRSDEKDIKKQLKNKLGDKFYLNIKYVDEIELTQSGKSKYLIQQLN